jgi:hypothetical protein
MAAVDDVGGDVQAFTRQPAPELEREEAVLAAGEDPGRDVRPLLQWPGLSEWGLGLAGLPAGEPSATISGGTSCMKTVMTSNSASGSRPSRSSCSRRAVVWPVFAHHAPGDSPGDGIIGATRTSSRTSTRSHSIGATKAASDCATTMRSARSPSTFTTASAYSPSPARSSSAGRSGVRTSWPRARSFGSDQVPVPRVSTGARQGHRSPQTSAASCSHVPYRPRRCWRASRKSGAYSGIGCLAKRGPPPDPPAT